MPAESKITIGASALSRAVLRQDEPIGDHRRHLQDYRISRLTPAGGKRLPLRSTLHSETVTLRLVLKTAVRHRRLAYLPDVSAPSKKSSKVVHRAWFSPEEYKQLYQATRTHAQKARDASRKAQEGGEARRVWLAEQLHDKVVFLANTGLRPDDAICSTTG